MGIASKTKKDRLTQLKELLKILADEIDQKPGARDMASLAKQYRETLKEIDDLQGASTDDDIGALLTQRKDEGKPGAVRKDRTRL